MEEITITLTREEVIYIENLLMFDKLDNVKRWADGDVEAMQYIETDEELMRKFNYCEKRNRYGEKEEI